MMGEVHGIAASDQQWLEMAAQSSSFTSPLPLRRRSANTEPITDPPNWFSK